MRLEYVSRRLVIIIFIMDNSTLLRAGYDRD